MEYDNVEDCPAAEETFWIGMILVAPICRTVVEFDMFLDCLDVCFDLVPDPPTGLWTGWE